MPFAARLAAFALVQLPDCEGNGNLSNTLLYIASIAATIPHCAITDTMLCLSSRFKHWEELVETLRHVEVRPTNTVTQTAQEAYSDPQGRRVTKLSCASPVGRLFDRRCTPVFTIIAVSDGVVASFLFFDALQAFQLDCILSHRSSLNVCVAGRARRYISSCKPKGDTASRDQSYRIPGSVSTGTFSQVHKENSQKVQESG
jgi:hypothetical protein